MLLFKPNHLRLGQVDFGECSRSRVNRGAIISVKETTGPCFNRRVILRRLMQHRFQQGLVPLSEPTRFIKRTIVSTTTYDHLSQLKE